MSSRPLLPGPISSRGVIESTSPSKSNKRINVSRACQACRRKRSRCDGQQPCRFCFSTQQECIYSERDGRRRYERTEQLRDAQSQMEDLKTTLHTLKFGSDQEALRALKELRTNDSDEWRTAYMGSVSPMSKSQQHDSSEKESGQSRTDEETNTPMLSPMQQARPNFPSIPQFFTVTQLPSHEVVEKAAEFFFNVIATIFHIMDRATFDNLCERVYSTEDEPTILDITEMCAIAAVGAQYNPRKISADIKNALYHTAVQYTNDLIEHDSLQALRALACLCMYGIIEKRQSTRALVHLGLTVARWSANQYKELGTEQAQWRKLYETAISLECWMSSTLGYFPDVTANEAKFVSGISTLNPDDTIEASQKMVSRLGMLKVEVLRYVCSASKPSSLEIQRHMSQLQFWYDSLPARMSLANLMEMNSISIALKGASCLAHAKYLGTVILLHRPVLAAAADKILGAEWNLPDVTQEQAQEYHDQSVSAARSLVRIFLLLQLGTLESKMLLRCWLSLFELSTACTILIYDVARRLSTNPHQEVSTLTEDLERAGSCVGWLKSSAKVDPKAEKMSKILSVIHDQLISIYSDSPEQKHHDTETNISVASAASAERRPSPIVRSPSKPYGSQETSNITMHAFRIVAGILKDPFGHGAETGFDLPSNEADWSIIDNDGTDTSMPDA